MVLPYQIYLLNNYQLDLSHLVEYLIIQDESNQILQKYFFRFPTFQKVQ